MSKLLQNTLEIICNISLSSAGYLLKINSNTAEVIAFIGEHRDKYKKLNEDITKLDKENNLHPNTITNLLSYKKIAEELSFKSFFVKKIYVPKNKEYIVYLFLFSGLESNYTDNNLKTVLNIIDTLSEQIKIPTSKPGKETPAKDEPGISLEDKIRNSISASSDQIFKSLLEASDDFIFILDNNGAFLDVNNNGALILDYSKEELTGKYFLDFIDFKSKAAIARSFQQILRSKNLHTFECVMISKNNKEINLEIKGKSVITGENVTGMLGVAKDITRGMNYENTIYELNNKLIEANRLLSIERARSNQRKAILEELNNLKSEFISNISHELRTPLASIIGFSETIASDPEMPVEMKSEFNQIILQEGKRLAKLINDILDLSKIESGNIDLTKVDFDVVIILKEVVEAYRKQINSKKITLTSEIPGEEIFINADKERVTQVFHELLSNAVKFTKQGGRISVIAQNLYREFEVIINDTGVGIPEKDLPYIFQKFYRVNRPGTEIPGTGLGLVFVKQIVDLHKGLITVQSGLDNGTSFVVKFPKSQKVQKK